MAKERSLIDAIVDLGEKVTGKPIEVQDKDLMMYGEDITQALDEITKNYEGGGSGGTSDYEDLENLPKINNVELKGNKTTGDLGINNVTANPTLAGGESDLTSIQVGETKYAIPSGGGSGATIISLLTLPQNPDEPEVINNPTDLATLEALNTAVEEDISNLPTFIKIGDYHICNLTEAIILNGSIRHLTVHYNAFQNTMVDYERTVEGDVVTWTYYEVTF